MNLQTHPRITQPDELYRALAQLYSGRDAESSLLVSARLILLLANQIGDMELLLAAIERAGDDPPTLPSTASTSHKT